MKAAVFIIIAVLLVSCGSTPPKWEAGAEQSHKWGYYTGQPVTRRESDGRSMTLLSELRYIDPKGVVWIAPPGSKVDGAGKIVTAPLRSGQKVRVYYTGTGETRVVEHVQVED